MLWHAVVQLHFEEVKYIFKKSQKNTGLLERENIQISKQSSESRRFILSQFPANTLKRGLVCLGVSKIINKQEPHLTSTQNWL